MFKVQSLTRRRLVSSFERRNWKASPSISDGSLARVVISTVRDGRRRGVTRFQAMVLGSLKPFVEDGSNDGWNTELNILSYRPGGPPGFVAVIELTHNSSNCLFMSEVEAGKIVVVLKIERTRSQTRYHMTSSSIIAPGRHNSIVRG